MTYDKYIKYIGSKAGYTPAVNKDETVSRMMADSYVRKALVTTLLAEGAIDESLARILLTKSLINNYI